MVMKVDDFIKKYYKQLHFNKMPVEVRAQFFDWVKKGQLTDEMRLWVRDYLAHDAAGNLIPDGAGGYELNNPLDPATTLVDGTDTTKLEELFKDFQSTLISMAAAKNAFKDRNPQAADFVDEYFGPGRLFNISPATATCRNAITRMVSVLNEPANLEIKKYVIANVRNNKGEQIFADQVAFDEFIGKVNSNKYDTDYKVQQNVKRVADVLNSAIGWSSSIESGTPEYNAILGIRAELGAILADDAFDGPIDSHKLDEFKNLEARKLLEQIYDNENIYSVFKNHDGNKFSKHIDKAKSDINWQDSKSDNYVPPKMDDELTLGQQLQKFLTDTYNDTLKKYEELRGGALAFSPEAKDIFTALDKNEIKPSQGLPTLLEKADAVKKKLKNPLAKQHFDWFIETMGPINANMPKAIAGAWKNARQMKAVVSQIILLATDPNNSDIHAMEKAKTAMQIMTAMRYGILSSKIMETIRKEQLTIFSDPKLSFNSSSKGMQFVSTALDKSIKAAFTGIGYGVTIVRNKIMLSGRKFTNKDNQNGPLHPHFAAEQQRLNDAKAHFDARKAAMDAQDTANIAANQAELHSLSSIGPGYSAATIDTRKSERDAHKTIMDTNQATYDEFNRQQQIRQTYASIQNERRQAHHDLRDITSEITNKNAALAALAPTDVAQQFMILQEIQALTQQQQQLQNNLNALDADLAAKQADKDAARRYVRDPANIAAHNAYETARTAKEDMDDKISRFENATQAITELNNNIAERERAEAEWPDNNKNKIVELENFWNFLQGNTTTFAFSQKKAQTKFDRNKNAMLQQYIAQHSLAA